MTKMIQSIFGDRKLDSRLDFISLTREGLSMGTLKKIQAYTSLSIKELAVLLPISERQLVRYKDDHILRKDISSHLIQLAELFEHGYEVFEEEHFRKWMRSKIRVLDNNRPIDLLDTAIGIQIVNDIIGRIDHGVYS